MWASIGQCIILLAAAAAAAAAAASAASAARAESNFGKHVMRGSLALSLLARLPTRSTQISDD